MENNQNLIQQNNLLENQNKLLEQMNDLLRRQVIHSNEVFVDNIDSDEMRNGFLVTSHVKKLWNVQIGLINEFARICKKHNLKWFAGAGTLLGAVRHKGFIPWDDDVDIYMMRPDYNKFLKIAAEELKYPYLLDNWYNYRLDSDETPDPLPNLPLITEKNRRKYPNCFQNFPLTKIRDLRTTMLEYPEKDYENQCIWIDIFPLDVVPPFEDDKRAMNFEVLREILIATVHPDAIKKAMDENKRFLISYNELKNFIKLPFRQRGIQFDNFAEKFFYESQKVGFVRNYALRQGVGAPLESKNYKNTIYLPFEEIELPAPAGWEEILKAEYGNWRKMIFGGYHAKEYSADIPYSEYRKTSPLLR